MREALISRAPGETRLVIAEDDRPVDFWVERDIAPSLAGRHFLARVRTVTQGLGGAFVDLGPAGQGFLDTKGLKAPAEGDTLVVRALSDAWGGKLPRVAAGAVFAGPSVVYDPAGSGAAVSRRLTDESARERLLDLALEWDAPGAFVFRKGAETAETARLAAEAATLRDASKALLGRAEAAGGPGPLDAEDGEEGVVPRFLADRFEGGLDRIVFDRPELRAPVERTLRRWPVMADVPFAYADGSAGPLFETADIAEEIDALAEDSAAVPGGARLFVETVRAATLIDVDTASAPLRGRKEEATARINAGAVTEIARQIRLRGIGGMILVDFAGDVRRGAGKRLAAEMTDVAADDPMNLRVMGVSVLGLLEMTRRRGRRPLADLLNAGGTDAAPGTTAAVLALMRALSDAARKGGGRQPRGRAGAAVLRRLMAPDMADARAELRSIAGAELPVSLDAALGMNDFAVE